MSDTPATESESSDDDVVERYYCCASCFEDHYLKDYIEAHGDTIGICAFCGDGWAPGIEPYKLKQVFAPLLSIYEIDRRRLPQRPLQIGVSVDEIIEPNREPLHVLIQRDWGLFNRDSEYPQNGRLLDAIVNSGLTEGQAPIDVYGNWVNVTAPFFEPSPKRIWQNFSIDVKYHQRYLLGERGENIRKSLTDTLLPPHRLEQMVEVLRVSDPLYRASSVDYHDFPEWQRRIGAPPSKVATSNRANASGIRALYACDGPQTAIAEIQPTVGDTVTVVDVVRTRDLRIINLSQPFFHFLKNRSPFGYADLRERIKYVETFQTMGREMARPVLPTDAHLNYVPTQYVAEWIRLCGYDGIKYHSATKAGGHSYVLFRPDENTLKNPTLYDVYRDPKEFQPMGFPMRVIYQIATKHVASPAVFTEE